MQIGQIWSLSAPTPHYRSSPEVAYIIRKMRRLWPTSDEVVAPFSPPNFLWMNSISHGVSLHKIILRKNICHFHILYFFFVGEQSGLMGCDGWVCPLTVLRLFGIWHCLWGSLYPKIFVLKILKAQLQRYSTRIIPCNNVTGQQNVTQVINACKWPEATKVNS